jgi:hypothetical protein
VLDIKAHTNLVGKTAGLIIYQVYIDANDPSRNLSTDGVRTLVRQLVAGFKYHRLGRGDTVCLVSFNDVSTEGRIAERLTATDRRNRSTTLLYT